MLPQQLQEGKHKISKHTESLGVEGLDYRIISWYTVFRADSILVLLLNMFC